MKRFIVFTLALLTWAYPIHVASAQAETNINEQPIINYSQFHATQSPSKTNSLSRGDVPTSPKKNVGVSTPSPYSGRHYTKEEVQALIVEYSRQYGIASDGPLCIAKKESGYNQFSKNKSSSASGVFQYLSSTWSATDEGKLGLSVFNADYNVRAAIKYMASRLDARPWVVAGSCPKITKI